MTIHAWLSDATERLVGSQSSSARLDAEIILAHSIGHPRTWLHAHPDEEIDLRHQEIANARLDLRLDRVPIAYIIGHKEFYGRRFTVSPHVLIPRPESEQVIELLAESRQQTRLFTDHTTRLVDIGCGSGALGITAKLEFPELDVSLVDVSKSALLVAEKNAELLNASVTIIESDLLTNYAFNPNIVLANLPYVDATWKLSEETRHEPEIALFAQDHGLKLIKRCFDSLSQRLHPSGIAIFEADPRQWSEIFLYAKKSGFKPTRERKFAVCFERE